MSNVKQCDSVLVFTFFKKVYDKTIIRLGFCDIRNNQGLGKCYQPQPSAPLIIDLSRHWLFLISSELIVFIFFQACEGAESSKSCNLIGSESRRYITILPANPGGTVGCFIHKFVCCLWMSRNRHFQTNFLLKLALLLALAREKWISLYRQKIWRENQASQPGKPLK